MHILLTNDDGIESPGLWAAAEALASLGELHVVAPHQQMSGSGRSLPSTSDGVIVMSKLHRNGHEFTGYGVRASPAQCVLHGLLEIAPERPALVVSGINYGENVGTSVTISGTVGAALEAAANGIPALAISLETDPKHHHDNSPLVDFSAAAHFTAYFARLMLANRLPDDVDVLKVDLPMDATPETPWKLTRISRTRYYEAVQPTRSAWDAPTRIPYRRLLDTQDVPGTDAYTVRVEKQVSVTPMSLDMTSRVDMQALQEALTSS